MRFSFPITNNVAEYEALAIGLNLVRRAGPKSLKAFVDSQLVARQLQGDYKVWDPPLKQYQEELARQVAKFPCIEISQIPREQNIRVDALSKMALLPEEQRQGVTFELMTSSSVPAQPKQVMAIEQGDWHATIIAFLTDGVVPDGVTLQQIQRKATTYLLVDGSLYKKAFSTTFPLLVCISKDEAKNVLAKI